ncbi:hypothetical protein [Caballeronia sp. LZ034LL]|uniref:hypothetical protein n=1 Tax=Caballeronia sp. LZ034LL TaxID=3038567 RepID=UPI002867042A|nr:hypothetical protein [Caballeronia sp. LZ034LL]MDR5837840.1 hypothetical protein [Caballeronia sp. LZ034LL]
MEAFGASSGERGELADGLSIETPWMTYSSVLRMPTCVWRGEVGSNNRARAETFAHEVSYEELQSAVVLALREALKTQSDGTGVV